MAFDAMFIPFNTPCLHVWQSCKPQGNTRHG